VGFYQFVSNLDDAREDEAFGTKNDEEATVEPSGDAEDHASSSGAKKENNTEHRKTKWPFSEKKGNNKLKTLNISNETTMELKRYRN